GLANGLLKAGIIDMSMTTESDHDIITMCLNLSHLTTNSGLAIVKRKAVKRTVFLYKEVKKEDWDQFRVELDGILKNKKALGLCEKQILYKNEQDHLDKIWGIIERMIIEAANKSLPKKKVSNFRHTKTKEFNLTYMHRPILQISSWMRFIRDRLGLPIEETD
ncbi:13405_t:CDS:1, partial [Gigaspora margarita]